MEERPLGSEVKEGLAACDDLRMMLDDRTPFGSRREEVDLKLTRIETLLRHILRRLTKEVH
jgi:hypothetical protein